MMSIKALVFCLAICLLASNTSAGSHSCCRRYMKGRLPFKVIRGYSVQSLRENCPINAIIFHTKNGGKVCTNPALSWVMDYVNSLRNKAQKVHNDTTQTQA
ncbi:C-C motif chemokine 20a.3 [Scomber japonicus]|uniref:C-C motif chemokine 20a.3 n=1 Tax=Scomber japonicus TaxID=13676 RepID=UPI0023056291|nr:C-C motif chemokine 20a.3 [Scomber japonicus]